MGKRRKLSPAAAGMAFAMLFAGGAMANTPANMLVVGQSTSDVQTVDPAFTFGHADIEIANNIYDRLIVADPNDPSRIVPKIAERWEFSPDGSKLTFFLRDGLKFHSGNPLTAEDVVYSLQRVVMMDSYITVFTQRFGWTKENIGDAVRAVDPLTVEVDLHAKLAPSLVLANFSTIVSTVVDKKLVMEHEQNGDWGREWLKSNGAGSGPFSISRLAAAAEGIILKANKDYTLGAPALDSIVIRNIPESSVQRLLLEKGDIDIARNLTRDQLDAVGKGEAAKVQRDEKWEMIWIATNRKHPILGNPKVVEAMRYLVDYQGMADSFLRDDMVVKQTFWPGEGSIDNLYALDVEKARALLKEAGYENGFGFKLEVQSQSPWPEVGQSIKATMADAGIDVQISALPFNVQMGNMRSRNYDATIGSFTAEYTDPDTFSPFFWNPDNRDEANQTESMAWRAYWDMPELTRMGVDARAESDPQQRATLYAELQRAVQQESPFIFMFRRNYATGIARNVQGFKPIPIWGGVFYDGVHKE